MAKFSVNSPCPCRSSLKYKKCCMALHKGAVAKDALTLMKSRYSAFALQKIEYIIKTSTSQKDYDDLLAFSQECSFNRLTILAFEESEDISFVTFRAEIVCSGVDSSFTEKSRFIKENNRWLYEGAQEIEKSDSK